MVFVAWISADYFFRTGFTWATRGPLELACIFCRPALPPTRARWMEPVRWDQRRRAEDRDGKHCGSVVGAICVGLLRL